MKIVSRAVGLAVACVTLGAGLWCAADWPQWRGPNRDGKLSGFTPPQTWPKQLAEKWKTEVGSADATPALVGDRLYAFTRQGNQEIISCLDAQTGNKLWQDKYAAGANVTGPAASHPGPRSSPAVADGKVVTFGVAGVLSCVDAASGKVLWRKKSAEDFPDAWPKFFTASSPLIIDGLVIAQLGGSGKGAVAAFDVATGQPKWKTDGDGPAYASPMLLTVAGTKQLVVQTEKSLVGLALSDGKPLWNVPTPIEGRAQNAVSPVIDGEVVIYAGQGAGIKAVTIEKQGDGFAAKPLWSNAGVNCSFSTPVLKDGMLFGLSSMANYFCLDAKTGKTLWTDATRHGERGFGSIVDAGSALIAMTSTRKASEIVAFKPSNKGFEELASIKLPDATSYAYPVLGENLVFVEDQKSIAAFTMMK